jgi:hypothetical protein
MLTQLTRGVCGANSQAKNRRFLAGFAVLVLAAVFTLAGCPNPTDSDDDGDPTYTLSFTVGEGGGTPPSSYTYTSGMIITLPGQETMTAPSGKTFNGWIADGQNYAAGDSYTVTGNVTFTAQWSSTGGLSAPTGLNPSVSGTSVTLSWNSVTDAASYRVYRSDSESGSYAQINGSISGTSYTNSGLSAGTYYYKVSAVSSSGNESPQSGSVSATVSSGGGDLSAPTGLNATDSGDSVNLSWNSVTDAASYKVYRSDSESGSYTQINGSISGTSYTNSGLSAGTDYYKVSAVSSSGNESPQSGSVSATVSGSNGGNGGGGDTLAGAKGTLTLSGFSEFTGKYVYSALVTSSGKYLIGTNGVEIAGSEAVISMVPISGGTAQVPLYTTNASGTTVADIYVPYEGSESFQVVSIIIVDDTDGKFTSSDAVSFATNYAALIGSNASNTSFTPSTTNGSITISRSDVMTMDEITAAMQGGDYTIMQTVKYMLMLAQ